MRESGRTGRVRRGHLDRRGMTSPVIPRTKAVLFDIDGTLIDTGGAGARSWSWAFEHLHGVPADIATSSSAGMTDPDVATRTFEVVLGRVPSDHELARLFAWYVYRLQDEVAISDGYRVLDGVVATLGRLIDLGIVLGIVSGGLEGSARIKLERGHLNRYFPVGAFGTDSRDRREITRVAIARVSMMHGRDIEPSDVDRRRRHPARRRRGESGGDDLARGRQRQLLRGRAPTIGCRLRTRFARGAVPAHDRSRRTVRPSIARSLTHPSFPSSMLRGCTARSGIWQRSWITSGFSAPIRRIWSSCAPLDSGAFPSRRVRTTTSPSRASRHSRPHTRTPTLTRRNGSRCSVATARRASAPRCPCR